MQLWIRVHEKHYANGSVSRVLAVCDEELLGSVFRGAHSVIDLKKYASFYKGELVSEARAVELIGGGRACADNLNLVGDRSLAAARKALKLNGSSVKRVAGVPHLQVFHVRVR